MLRFLLDECLPHAFAKRLADRGFPDSVHPIHLGLLSAPDHVIVGRALVEARIVITTNGVDFRKLLAKEGVHAGLILLPNAEFERSWRLVLIALAFLEIHSNPADFMVNRVLELSASDGIRAYELPPAVPGT